MYHCANEHSEAGIVLISTLLFLFVITLLGLMMAQSAMLQIKMQQNFQQRTITFQMAENNLRRAEQALSPSIEPVPTDQWSYERWKGASCDNKVCYEVTAIGKNKKFQTVLRSIYVIDETHAYRMAWWLVENN